MFELALLKMVHVLGLVYWLGTDLGVFYSSLFVVDEKRSPEVRIAAAKILFTLDFAPRVCMPLMLPTGVHLAKMMGAFKVPDMVVAACWVVGLFWVGMVVFLNFTSNQKAKERLFKVDFNFRLVVIAILLVFAAYELLTSSQLLRDWLVYKVIVFAGTIACGLAIRVKLRQFTPAFRKLVEGVHSDADSSAISRSLIETRPYVIAIWIGLLANTAWSVKLI